MTQIDTITLERGDYQNRAATGDAAMPTLLFFHIGKTGGTSLTHYFRSLAREFYVQFDPDDCSRLEVSDGATFPDFISGHYPVGPWLHRLPASWRTMLVIRNPVQHLLSSYWHIRTHPDVDGDAMLQDLIDDARRFDLGTVLRARTGECFEKHFDNPQARFILDKKSGPLDTDDLARATELVASVNYVGTTERLDCFVAQVAALMPWAAGWEATVLPRSTVNPLNVLLTDEVPRPLLRDILAVTEFDAELHQLASRLQAERLGEKTRCAVARRPPHAEPSPSARVIPVADLIRVFPLRLRGVCLGQELTIDDDKILLHPADPDQEPAIVTIDDIPLDGHSEIAGQLTLAHEGAAPVRFDIELSRDDAILVAATFNIARGEPLEICLRFLPATGPSRLTLRTDMIDGHSNDFAWATFVGLMIC